MNNAAISNLEAGKRSATETAVRAWTEYIVEAWERRLRDYGRVCMPSIQHIENRFVPQDVWEKVNVQLNERSIPITILCNAKSRISWMIFRRAPTKEELNRVRRDLIELRDDEDRRGGCRRVLWLVYSPESLLILDALVLEVDTADDNMRGGKIYVSYEGNAHTPFEMRIPGIASVHHRSLNMWKFPTIDARLDLDKTIFTIRVHDKDDILVWVDVGSLESLFECKIIR